eukprot:GEMP01046972.1.p1 GENE.GEMP01046972.1~~GEMP01046972.1.p1  ORF type:complete len:259 (+),score=71.37 GEMP01046972.1:43-819(+)
MAESRPLSPVEIIKVHREMQAWILSSDYKMTDTERKTAFGMQNRATLVGAAFGMLSYVGIRRVAPRLALAQPALKTVGDALHKWAAIPALLVYLRVYRDYQLFMLPIFYNEIMRNEEGTPFAKVAIDVVNGMRGRSSRDIDVTDLMDNSQQHDARAVVADPWATPPDVQPSSADDPWIKPPGAQSSSANDPWAKPPDIQPAAANDPWTREPWAEQQAAPSTAGDWFGTAPRQDTADEGAGSRTSTWDDIRAKRASGTK